MIKDFKHFNEDLENDPYGEEIWDEDKDLEAHFNVEIIGGEHRFLNFYECDACGTTWEDESDNITDDACPNCAEIISPYESQDLEV